MQKLLVFASGLCLSLGFAGCSDKNVDVTEPSDKGGPCDPAIDPEVADGPHCLEGLACDPVAGATDTYVCGSPVRIHGTVIDLVSEAPIEGALVNGLDRTGSSLGAIAVTDAEGHYELLVSAPREADGELSAEAKYTLQGFAVDYQPFPAGIRVALPVDPSVAVYDEELAAHVIESPLTTIGLIALPEERRGGVTISGTLGGVSPGGALVVAEGVSEPGEAPYGVSDFEGKYTIFNVPEGAVTVRAYHRSLELEPAAVTVADAALTEVDLAAVAEGEEMLGRVSGSVSIVNAPGGSVTSVVLVPTSVFNVNLQRGPVPFGLRAPDPGLVPDVSGSFAIAGVPAGTYKVLAAFENDGLVRDPDVTIGGTSLQEVTVAAGEGVTVPEGFKITEALEVVGPGKEEPERVGATPTFEFADDSSEDYYIVRVFDVFGELVWENPMVPGVSGSATVQVPYEGDALSSGMYYQFRAISMRDKGGGTAISQTEDLRGVFIVE